MHFLRSFPFVVTIALAAANVQAYVSSSGAGYSRLPVRAIGEKLYERDVDAFYERDVNDLYERDIDDLFERDFDNLFERDFNNLYEREFDSLYERDSVDFYERDVDDLYERALSPLLPRAGTSGSRSSGSRSSSCRTPSPRPGFIQVKMGEAKLLPLPSQMQGIETTGICGCTGVAIIGGKGVVVAHIGPGDKAPIQQLSAYALQVGSPARSVIYAPTEHGQLMDPKEVTSIQHALGHIVPVVNRYAFAEGPTAAARVLMVTRAGAVSWT
ncbi:hypothetical protein MMC19_005479 [Ptychographa xylographoides]|nr:hypothetical protein [Ptychographa xylographoides]